jgi:hypothetical protein
MKAGFSFCAMLVIKFSSVALTQTVYVDYKHNIEFNKFRTYAWAREPIRRRSRIRFCYKVLNM